MALWGRNDQSVTANSTTTVESSNGAPIGTHVFVKSGGGNSSVRVDGANAHYGNTSAGSRANVDVAMFGNVTMSAFVPGIAVGVFGVSANDTGSAPNEIGTTSGNLSLGYVSSGGSGYTGNAVVTLTFANGSSNATAVNAFANVTAGVGGHITALLINQPGSGYSVPPTVTIAAPSAINITANTTGVSNTTDTILVSTANSKFQAGDRLYYTVPTNNTAITGLTGNSYYYVTFANTTALAVSLTKGGANADIAETRVGAGEVHTLTGDTATGFVVVGGAKNMGIAHAGWNLRTVGSGGRAGRVQYETLVAMGSLGAQTAAYGTPANVSDAADDAVLPDA